MWRWVVDQKYEPIGGGWCTKDDRGSYGVSLWKYIQKGRTKFSQFIKFEVGDDTRTKLWLDTWCGGEPLRESFHELFRIARIRRLW